MNYQPIYCRINGIFLGKVADLWGDRPPSAIDRITIEGPQEINEFGFLEDEQADLEHHGGHEKAIHHYASEHYSDWIADGEMPSGSTPAAFGENISTSGMTEWTLCIGDKLRLGTAIVQISQGRQPCWKVSEFTKNKKMAYLFQKTGRTGWYYRVLEPGFAATGDSIELMERTQPKWSVARVTSARLTRRGSQQDIEALAALPELAKGWRQAFQQMADGNRDEETNMRLSGRS